MDYGHDSWLNGSGHQRVVGRLKNNVMLGVRHWTDISIQLNWVIEL